MTDELRVLMKEQWNLIRLEIRELTKFIRSEQIGSVKYMKSQREIERLENLTRFYMVGKTKPIRVNGEIVVNGILLNQIMKKMSRVRSYKINVSKDDLIVEYRTDIGEGKFTLNDISKYYGKWPIPETVIN